MPNVTMYGGFYQPNQNQINNGLWAGASLIYLCNQVGGITSTCTVTVTDQGTNNFTYDMVNNGINFNNEYNTYNNITGNLKNQTQPVIIILAYQVNGSNLPSSSQPAPRLVTVGPEGLLMIGTGGKSITSKHNQYCAFTYSNPESDTHAITFPNTLSNTNTYRFPFAKSIAFTYSAISRLTHTNNHTITHPCRQAQGKAVNGHPLTPQ